MSIYQQNEATEFALRITALGFKVYLAERGTYGFITDDTGERVLSFQFTDGGSLGGNYGPPSKESGTGWRIDGTGPYDLKTAEQVRAALYATAPGWCGKGWKNYTTAEQELETYGASSGFQLVKEVGYRRGRNDYQNIAEEAANPDVGPVEVSAEEYWDMLECVPPIYVRGGFLVGEASCGHATGTVYAHYAERDGKYFAKYAIAGRPETYIKQMENDEQRKERLK
jgi:hypothetical protein